MSSYTWIKDVITSSITARFSRTAVLLFWHETEGCFLKPGSGRHSWAASEFTAAAFNQLLIFCKVRHLIVYNGKRVYEILYQEKLVNIALFNFFFFYEIQQSQVYNKC